MSGCFFSVLLQKVKIKIQNDVIVHQSASLSVNEDVRINFKQSKQSFNALKCQKCAIIIKSKNAHSRAVRTNLVRTNLVFFRSIVFKFLGPQVLKSGIRLSQGVDEDVYGHGLRCYAGPLDRFQVSTFKSTISMLTPGPLVQQISLFDRTFYTLGNSIFDVLCVGLRSNVFKSSFQVFQVKRTSS